MTSRYVVRRLLQDDDERQRMKASVSEVVRSKLSWDTLAQEFERIYVRARRTTA